MTKLKLIINILRGNCCVVVFSKKNLPKVGDTITVGNMVAEFQEYHQEESVYIDGQKIIFKHAGVHKGGDPIMENVLDGETKRLIKMIQE